MADCIDIGHIHFSHEIAGNGASMVIEDLQIYSLHLVGVFERYSAARSDIR
jgi:hypothetical protein